MSDLANQGSGRQPSRLFVPWGVRDVILGLLMAAALVPVLTFALVVLLGVLQAFPVRGLDNLPTSLVLLGEVALFVPVWYLGVRKHRTDWTSVGFRSFRLVPALTLAGLSMAFSMGFNLLWSLVLAPFGLQAQPDLAPLLGSQGFSLPILLLSAGLIAPLAEEAFFRGFVYAGLRSRLSVPWAVLASAALFSAAHLLPTTMPPLFVLGALFALLYEYTGSIWPAIALHVLTNTAALLVASLLASATV